MLYAIMTQDAPSTDADRAKHREGHLNHFKAHKNKIALSGPLSTDEGGGAGSLVIYDAQDAREARQFIEADPFFGASVWSQITVQRFKYSIANPALLGV